MTSITLRVTGAAIQASVAGTLTSGMVGIPVTIEYDEAWEGLTKNLVCRCSKSGFDDEEYRSILNVGNTSVVAHEVMQAGTHLYLGVEGFSPDGKLVIPTTWVMCGVIQKGANTGEDLSTDPTLPVWNQLQTQIEQLESNSIPQELLDEIQASVETAVEAASSAERSKKSASAASVLAVNSAESAEASADSARASMEDARTSVSSAAYLANETLRLQRAAEAAAERAEDAVNVEMTAALADYFSHVMPQFDDANGLVYVNAVLTALGAEPRGEGGDTGGEEVPDEPDQPGGDITGDALPTNGLMAYFDLRNLGDKANVTVGTAKGVVATQGSGALFSWASQPITGSDEYGSVLNRGLSYSSNGQSVDHDMGDHFTVVVTTRGAPCGWNAYNSNVAYVDAEPAYLTADGTAKAGRVQVSGDKTGYNTQVYCIDGETQTMYLNTVEVCKFNGADYADFVRWEAKPAVGTIYSAGTTVAAAFYNRALTKVEIVEVQAFMETLEVTA